MVKPKPLLCGMPILVSLVLLFVSLMCGVWCDSSVEYEAVPLVINGVEQPILKVLPVDFKSRRIANARNKKIRLEKYRNMSDLLGVGPVKRCPFEYMLLEKPYDPLQITNRAVDSLFKQGYFQAALTCFKTALRILESGQVAADSPEQMQSIIANVKDNIKNMKLLLTPPQNMITPRIFHIPSSKKYPHSSTPVFPKKDQSIMIFDGALSTTQCEHLIGLFEASELYQGNIFNGEGFVVDTKNKNVWEFDISGTAPNDPIWAAVDRLMVSVTIKHILKYEKVNLGLNTKVSPLSDGGFQMKRYRPVTDMEARNLTEHHAYHIDSGHFPHCGPQRLIAVILYLNDVAEGGETVFLNQGLVVKPKCGRLLMFPTALQYTHAGRAPISNTKYDIVGFIME